MYSWGSGVASKRVSMDVGPNSDCCVAELNVHTSMYPCGKGSPSMT